LLPSATEIVCALGLESDLVGVTHECDYPPSVREKPVLTASVLSGHQESGEIDRHIRALVHAGSSIYRLDAERLQSLQPDLILTQELCEVCAVSYPIVERAVRRMNGATQLVSLEPESLDDVFQTIATVGDLVDRVPRAQAVITELRRRVAGVRAAVEGRPRRRVLCIEWVEPLFGSGHWTPELVRLAGGEECLGRAGRRAEPVTPDVVANLHPEVVVVMPCGFGMERTFDEVRRSTLLRELGGELWAVDGNAYFSRPGPRLVDSLEIMAAILHPEVMAKPSLEAARRVA
jgi:iron complex transport system substrate-binding protein